MPASWAGSEPDGALSVDADGRFVVGPEVRRFFDYFLAAAGEMPAEQLRAHIVAAIEAQLPPAAAAAAVELLDRYLAFRRQARALAVRGVIPTDLRQRLDALRRLRRQVLGNDDAQALFGAEELQVELDLQRREVLQARDLSPEERQARLDAIETHRPPAASAARAAAELPQRLADDEAALRDAGGNPEEIQALRQQAVGDDAAERLAELDREQAEWQARVEAFTAARLAIEADPSLAQIDQQRRIEALLESQFVGTERMRVRNLTGLP